MTTQQILQYLEQGVRDGNLHKHPDGTYSLTEKAIKQFERDFPTAARCSAEATFDEFLLILEADSIANGSSLSS